ncbi:hypothetical protein Ahy_A08g039147 [Arachis hypogaea]|uniref:MULE transposase domain-containing protein n=1 Tax=Arachis hypogaea TaxID=3818 RepID=A0A445BVV5_ARAHY|nr:hypothetical protein Ahy_A08g039147 [Arachis hypogaea]
MNANVTEMMNYFMRMKDINPNFFYAMKLDEKYKFRSAVWVDVRCRASYEYYGDIVSIDSTYSTDSYEVVKHGLLFVSFVGVNYHGKSTFFGCALLGNEEILSYKWVFNQWVKCMGTAPQRIITDQCRSIFHAIKNALLDTRHLWCIWHITKKLSYKLRGYRRYKECYDDLDIVWNSRTEESFEDNGVSVVAEERPSVCMKVEEEKLVNDTILCVPYDVHFDCSTQEVHSLCAHFYNVAQEFVDDDDETALLHAALEETRVKLASHRAKKRSESMAETHTSIGLQSSNVVGVVDTQGPSKVTTKGWPKSKRLGAALEKFFRKSARRKNKNASLVVRPEASQDVNFSVVVGWNDP